MHQVQNVFNGSEPNGTEQIDIIGKKMTPVFKMLLAIPILMSYQDG
jgi:hypothetical protein